MSNYTDGNLLHLCDGLWSP